MYFLRPTPEGLKVQNIGGKQIGVFELEYEDEVREIIALHNSRQDIKLFCEQVAFWHSNFRFEKGTDLQKTTSKIISQMTEDVSKRL